MVKTFADFIELLREHPDLVVTEITLHPDDLEALRRQIPERIGGGYAWHGIRVYSNVWNHRGHVRFEASKRADIDAVIDRLRKLLPSL